MSAYSAVILADGAKAYWRLGEASGTSAADAAASPANGTYTGTYTLGVAGSPADTTDTAVDLAGSGVQSEIVVGTPAKLNGLTNWTLEAWVRLDVGGQGCGFITRDFTTGVRFELGAGADLGSTDPLANRLMGGFYNGNWRVARDTADIPLGVWQHVVITWVASTKMLRLYRQGAEVANFNSPDLPPTTDTTIRLGRRHDLTGGATNHWYLNGRLDEVAIYDLALSAGQVLNHYQLSFPKPVFDSSAAFKQRY